MFSEFKVFRIQWIQTRVELTLIMKFKLKIFENQEKLETESNEMRTSIEL